MLTSELAPFAKSGGLADAVAGLAGALAHGGTEVLVLMPKYRRVEAAGARVLEDTIEVGIGAARLQARLWSARLAVNLTLLLIDVPELFDRPGLYDEEGEGYDDNLLRFAAFSRAALAALRAIGTPCEVLHAHDWQAALAPMVLKEELSEDPFFAGSRSVLTVHNLAYQGSFPADQYPHTGLDARYFTVRYGEFFGSINLLKTGIVTADGITTVSPTYAREVLLPENGAGLDGVLRDRADDFHGIRNGIDEQVWDPAADPYLACRYRAGAPQGKGKCRRALLDEVGLPRQPDLPVFGVASRLVEQKGIDLLIDVIPRFVGRARWVIVGTGEHALERALRDLAADHPELVAVRIAFDEGLAHRIQAGSDFLLMPSRFEPCGLNQMYAMRYGTIPVVSRVGGLVDTVIDVDEHPGESNGVMLPEVSVDGLARALERAIMLHGEPRLQAALRRRGMAADFSWHGPAREYDRLYRAVLDKPRAPVPPGPTVPIAR
ncbi:MAG: glycogen synthase GlgA [Acidobacteriota bacterium]|jgi:starch synthase